MNNAVLSILFLSLFCVLSVASEYSQTTGLFYGVNPTPGVNLFTLAQGSGTYLLSNEGELIHRWDEPDGLQSWGLSYITDEGTLIRTTRDPAIFDSKIKGVLAGRIREYNAAGTCLWEFRYISDDFIQHHDIIRFPNGNIMTAAHRAHSLEEAWAKGYTGEMEEIYRSDTLVEVSRFGGRHNPEYDPAAPFKDGNLDNTCKYFSDERDVLWEWDTFQYDNSKDPFTIDINLEPLFNALEYIVERGQIVVGCVTCDEFFIIKPDYEHGGADILYRWGNPQNYGAVGERKLGFQHSLRWYQDVNGYHLPWSRQNEDSLILLNDRDPAETGVSSLGKLTPPYNKWTRKYELREDGTFGPDDFDFRVVIIREIKYNWELEGVNFFSEFTGTVQWLPGNNFLVGANPFGLMYELDHKDIAIWKYVVPYTTYPGNDPKGLDTKLGKNDVIPECGPFMATCNVYFSGGRISYRFKGLKRFWRDKYYH